ncbi:MAG: hypothetical protein JSU00_02575 [Acidobacteria bacterium]|nr:hypothetical protein [Acidobacteriota bacterium]
MTLRSLLMATLVAALMTVSALAASIDGKWTGEMQTPNGSRPVTFTFAADGSTLNGSTTGRGGEIKISNGKVDGDNISFDVTREFQGNSMTMHYTGKVSGDDLKLSITREGGEPREMSLKRSK